MTSSTKLIDKTKVIGLVGVGTMGKCILSSLKNAEYIVSVYDPFPGAIEFAKGKGAMIAETLEKLAEVSQLIILSLPAQKQVFDVVEQLKPKLTQNHIIIDTSTVSPDTSKKSSQIIEITKASYIDAPILGRPSAVGKWILPSGGNADVIEFVRPVLETFAERVVRVGDIGSGNALKLLNQLMFSVINGISSEVMALAEIVGVEKKVFYDVIANSNAATVSGLFRETGKKIVEEDYCNPTFTVELLCKDAGLGIQMARENGVAPLIAEFVQIINENTKSKGLGKQDTSAVSKLFDQFYSKM